MMKCDWEGTKILCVSVFFVFVLFWVKIVSNLAAGALLPRQGLNCNCSLVSVGKYSHLRKDVRE